MRPVFGLFQVELSSSNNNLFAVPDKIFQDFFQGQQLWPVIDDRQQNDAKTAFHPGVLIELIGDDLSGLIFFKANGDPHAVPV